MRVIIKKISLKLFKTLFPRLFYIFALHLQFEKQLGSSKAILAQESIDRNGNPIPWITYPAIDYLSSFNFIGKKVLEFGSGNSTLWWENKGAIVTSIEHDSYWYKKMVRKVKSAKIIYESKNFDHYLEDSSMSFDIISIDGGDREVAGKAAVLHFQTYGGDMIILDNSDWYDDLILYIDNSLNYFRVDFHGFTPLNDYKSVTSIWLSIKAMGNLDSKTASKWTTKYD
jgi:hypothetical protein